MIRRAFLAGLMVLLVALPTVGTASVDERIVAFGDSLGDPGNAFALIRTNENAPFDPIPGAPYARGGHHFSNGPTWIEHLAGALHLGRSAGPAFRVPGVFSNYAVGGARARGVTAVDLSGQVSRFLADFGGAAPPGALYIVHIGADDLRDAVEALAADPSGATSAAIVEATLVAIQTSIERLADAGARTFLVPNSPNLTLVPALLGLPQPVRDAATALSVAFNTRLEAILGGVEALGLAVVRLDIFELFTAVVADPAAFGFVEVAQPCITPFTKVSPFCARPDEHVFWDFIHPTRAGHALIAEAALAALTTP
jgi:phospholipase/lecithinase/hemolysin